MNLIVLAACLLGQVRDIDDSPWMPAAETKKIKTMWPRGVPLPADLQFYDLPQVSQKLYTMNGGSPFRDIVQADDVSPWVVSGGMHHVPKSDWRSVKGLVLPGKISVWEEWTDVGAFGPVPKVRWRFPVQTLAYDVLIKKGTPEHIFEVRVHERGETGWDHGTTYRPRVDGLEDATRHQWTWGFGNAGIAAKSLVYSAQIDPRAEFAPTSKIVNDGKFVPEKYIGAGAACNTCHARVGETISYAKARRGDDGRFSWHPWIPGTNGKIDHRWPIATKAVR